ncbi:MAG: CoA transferase [Candidatus Lambdaproteobacteria bacterium]|nr:CoA transferase [Candidatus Lambdaproteobacteria bacterium]
MRPDAAPPQPAADEVPVPLTGIHVVELGGSVAAPYATEILADLGAHVVKVEKPDGGDDARGWGPPFWHGASSAFQVLNRNKYSVTVDLKDPGELARLRNYIAAQADVVIQNMRPGIVDRIGLGAEALRRRKPALIYCNLGAFGAHGPERMKPGYDPLMQAFGGIMSVTGENDRPPVRVGTSIIDMGTGLWCVVGILAALNRRSASGEGSTIDSSLYETALAWMANPAASYAASGEVPTRHGSGMPMIVPYQAFPASDGYMVVASPTDTMFYKLAEVLGHPEWRDDPRFAHNPERVAQRGVLVPLIESVMRTQPREHWRARLEAVGVPCAVLQTVDEVLAHPQTQALGILQPVPGLDMTQIGLPLSFDGQRPTVRLRPPRVGEHTDLILNSYSKDEP